MSNRNPQLGVKVCLPNTDAQHSRKLIDLLVACHVLRPVYDYGDLDDGTNIVRQFIINPPKNVTSYAFWAENTERYIKRHYEWPCMTVRTSAFTTKD